MDKSVKRKPNEKIYTKSSDENSISNFVKKYVPAVETKRLGKLQSRHCKFSRHAYLLGTPMSITAIPNLPEELNIMPLNK